MDITEEGVIMLNLQIGIIKDLNKQGFLTKSQMETAIDIVKREFRKTNEAVTAL